MTQSNRDPEAGVEIRKYRGDFEDIAELTRRVYVSEYKGRAWVSIWEPAFLRWWLDPQRGAICVGAYARTKLVGTIWSIPESMRIGSTLYKTAMYANVAVDPDYRRLGLGLALLERLRRENDERGVAFGFAAVLDDHSSSSYSFSANNARRPQDFRFLFRFGYWGKYLAPRTIARAGNQLWERMACRALGPLLAATPYGYDPHVREYRAQDLERCAQLLEMASAQLDWAQVRTPEELSFELEGPGSGTLVYERHGRVDGLIHFRCFSLLGRELVRVASIMFWADDGLTGMERIRLLSHVCTHLRDRGVHGVMAIRGAMMPAGMFVANLFVPASQHFLVGVFFTPRTGELTPPRAWSFEIG